MQAFQPRPIELPGGSLPSFGSGGNNTDWSKITRIGVIVFLCICAIAIISVGRSYTATQRTRAQNQDIRPLGVIHTDSVQLITPTASEIVRLPLFIQGTARIEWFADGIFPIEVRDSKNNLLASTYGIADIVEPGAQTAHFRAVVEGFEMKPETRIGRVILYRQVLRENPSTGDIAAVGVDFSTIGNGWAGTKTSSSITTTNTTSTTTQKDSVWTNTNQKNSQTSGQKKTPTGSGYQPVLGGPFTCGNGVDDDRDGVMDADDPSCHTDGYPTNNATYDSSLDEAKRALTERDADGNLPGQTNTTGSQSTSSRYNQSVEWTGNAKIRVKPSTP